jgi:cell division protein FtsB
MASRNKNWLTRLLFHQVTLSVLGFLILFAISVPLARNVSQRYRISQEVKELEQEIGELGKKNSELKNLINYLQSDQFIEEQARLNLNYKKEGEKMVVIKEKNESTTSEEVDANIFTGKNSDQFQTKSISNPQRWWRYFFK